MLLNKHKNYVYVGVSALGFLVTLAMVIIGGTWDWTGSRTVSPHQLANYGFQNVVTTTNASSGQLKSENIKFEFMEPDSNGAKQKINPQGFSTLEYALKNANEREPSIFSVHGITDWKDGSLEFRFDSVSPTDYESEVFRKTYSPFQRLANSEDIRNIKFISTINPATGSRHVAVEITVPSDKLSGRDAKSLWNKMLTVLSPLPANTSYDLTLISSRGLTVHGSLSSATEQENLGEDDLNKNWEGAMALATRAGVQQVDLYMHSGTNKADTTVAVTVAEQADLNGYISGLTSDAANEDKMFPREFTTTITVDGETAPTHIYQPTR